jgi:hypothetical protein
MFIPFCIIQFKFRRFYINCLLPELIDPQYGRRLVIGDIKDPPYITEAQKAAENKKPAKKHKTSQQKTVVS